MSDTVDLRRFDNSWYKPGGSTLRRVVWYIVGRMTVSCHWNPSSSLRARILRLFGARIGRRVVLRPGVNIKYPWRLTVGDDCWIGEDVWIDNLADVRIGDNVCLSQGAMLLCGNHDYTVPTFDLMIGDITLEDGAWVGCKSVVCPGVTMGTHSVLAVGSTASHDLAPYGIYRGNPAVYVKQRKIDTPAARYGANGG